MGRLAPPERRLPSRAGRARAVSLKLRRPLIEAGLLGLEVFPMRSPAPLALYISTAIVLLLAQQRPASAAWPHDPTVNVALGSTVSRNFVMSAVSDGAGGAFLAMTLDNTTNFVVSVQHVLADGSIAPGWPAAGVVVSNTTGQQDEPCVARDGAGGVYVAWTDYRSGVSNSDIYVQRLNTLGLVAPGW